MNPSYKSNIFLWLFVTSLMMNQSEGEPSTNGNKQNHFDNDFEGGTLAPWVDLSEGETHWTIESFASDSGIKENMTIQPPFPPPEGQYFLLLNQDVKMFDIGILSTTNFVAIPGDMVQFSYWISSTYSQFQNLQVTIRVPQ